MPLPCAVEAHVTCWKLGRWMKALSVTIHGASPWHLRECLRRFCSSVRESPRRKAVASKSWYRILVTFRVI